MHNPRTCASCAAPIIGRGRTAKFCSTSCFAVHEREYERLRSRRRGTRQSASKRATCLHCSVEFAASRGKDKVSKYCSRTCMWAYKRQCKTPPTPSTPITYRDCIHCGHTLIARGAIKYCGDECRRQRNIARTIPKVMGLYRAAFETGRVKQAMHWRYELVGYLRERDGDRCDYCTKPITFGVTTGPRGDNAMGPSIDHIQPVSKGGTDELTNLRLLHWDCNRRRGNRGGGEQLRLIA